MEFININIIQLPYTPTTTTGNKSYDFMLLSSSSQSLTFTQGPILFFFLESFWPNPLVQNQDEDGLFLFLFCPLPCVHNASPSPYDFLLYLTIVIDHQYFIFNDAVVTFYIIVDKEDRLESSPWVSCYDVLLVIVCIVLLRSSK